MDKEQTMRVSKDEVALVKQFLESREDATIVLRNHFLQLEVTADEQEYLNSLSPALRDVLKKMMMPSLTRDVPLDQEASMYSRLTTISQVTPDVGLIHIQANDILTSYLKQEFKNLEEGNIERTIILDDLPNELGVTQNEQRVINMMAYNLIIPIVEGRIKSLIQLIAPPELTEEQKKAITKAQSTR